MPIDTVFLSLSKDSRRSNYLKFQADEGVVPTYGPEYQCMYLPMREAVNTSDDSVVTGAKRGQTIRLIPACVVSPRVYRVLVVVNPEVHRYAQCASCLILEPGETDLSFYATFRRDMEDLAGKLPWLVRIYLIN